MKAVQRRVCLYRELDYDLVEMKLVPKLPSICIEVSAHTLFAILRRLRTVSEAVLNLGAFHVDRCIRQELHFIVSGKSRAALHVEICDYEATVELALDKLVGAMLGLEKLSETLNVAKIEQMSLQKT